MPVLSIHQQEMIERLFPILKRLYDETEGFLEHPENQQHWYNRGYANGMVQALQEHGYGEWLAQHLTPDAEDVIAGHEALAWGQAYHHGVKMGSRETHQIIGPKCSANDE